MSASPKILIFNPISERQKSFITEVKSLRMQPCINGIYFEKNWPDFLNGEIYTQ